MLAAGDFTTLGGMDRANHALARHLALSGREVHLVAHRVSDDLRAIPGVVVHDVPRPGGAHLAGAPLLARTASATAKQLGNGTRVLVNGGNTDLPAASWIHYLHAAYAPRVAASLRTRLSAALGRHYYLRAERRAIASSPVLVCNSRRTAEDVQAAYGGSERCQVVYYGVDPLAFGAPSPAERAAARAALALPAGRRVAVFIGALGDRRKGFDLLFDAWSTLIRDPQFDVDLAVVGTGGELDAWRGRAHAAGLQSRVHFLGFRSDVASVIGAADLLVHPARYEAYGLGIHEALCREVPAIVSGVCGIAERYPRELGGLVLPDRPTAAHIVNAVRAWRAAEEAWRSRVTRFAATLRARTWDDMAGEIAALLEHAA
jgi:glycosyltransferase involved in cell wall biosynthesis